MRFHQEKDSRMLIRCYYLSFNKDTRRISRISLEGMQTEKCLMKINMSVQSIPKLRLRKTMSKEKPSSREAEDKRNQEGVDR